MAVAAGLALALAAGCSSTVELKPEASTLAPNVTTVVGLPISLGFGGDGDLRRLQRRTSDALIAATGGHAVIAEELVTGEDDAAVSGALHALGEDPARALTFATTLSMKGRVTEGAAPIPGFLGSRRMVVDFRARIEIRHLGNREIIGTVDAIASGVPNEPELSADGERRGPLAAVDAAVARAIATFAPRLTAVAAAQIVEVPVDAASSMVRRLTVLGELYPELSIDQMQLLAQTRERFLVLDPGVLGPLGILSGDLLGVPGAPTSASRAAL
ncbi:MAG TPA: hypothetical protein VHG72_23135, partial [Polyangia bacterium]|nr:hypothetical protein [Polyangia bacterium]